MVQSILRPATSRFPGSGRALAIRAGTSYRHSATPDQRDRVRREGPKLEGRGSADRSMRRDIRVEDLCQLRATAIVVEGAMGRSKMKKASQAGTHSPSR